MTTRTYRPFGARVAVAVVALLLVVSVVLMWLGLPADVRAEFSAPQRVTLVLFLGVVLAVLYGVFRTAVRTDSSGLTIVNVYKVRHLEWPAVLGVSLAPGQPWAVLDVSDGTTVALMGIQGSDGRRARDAVTELRALIDEQSSAGRDG